MNGGLISRSALLDFFDAKAFTALELFDGGMSRKAWLEAFEAVQDAPAVDAVEVVMCKDCKYFMEFRPEHPNVQGADGDCYIRVVCSEDHQFNAVRGCDYCSYGERKDGW